MGASRAVLAATPVSAPSRPGVTAPLADSLRVPGGFTGFPLPTVSL